MYIVKGKWYDGKSSLQIDAQLTFYDNGAVVIEELSSGRILLKNSQLTANISDRLADTPRFLTFKDGATFETDNHLVIDEISKILNRSSWKSWVYLIESKKRYVLITCSVVLIFIAVMVTYGIPTAANVISRYLPQSYYELADQQTLKALKRLALKPSRLNHQTEARIRANLQPCIDAHQELGITLLFMQGGRFGPNAFALPGGTIIFTDELVELSQDDEELIAILAHEIGHVVHRHGMRRMIQDSLLSFAMMSLTGDASGISEIFLGLPVILTELAYSREFERNADKYALRYLLSDHISPERFVDILVRIDKDHKNDKAKLLGYLSTHPPTSERVELFQQQELTINSD